MQTYKLETTLFGELEVFQEAVCTDQADAIVHYGNYKLVFDGNEKIVDLCIFNVLTNERIKAIEDMLDNVPKLYEKGKKAILSGKDSNELIKYFIEFHIEELDEIHKIFGVDSNDEISSAMFIEKLLPRAVAINVDQDNMIDCTLDFSLPKEYTDELLVVRFNNQYEIYGITHES